jgi:hypothetical protein
LQPKSANKNNSNKANKNNVKSQKIRVETKQITSISRQQFSLKKGNMSTTLANQAVFQSTTQALHVSYIIHSLPAASKSPTQIVIERLVKENHVWDGLPEPRESTVNFAGLTPLEVRGQCAQVLAMVDHLPHKIEAAAVKAIYGHQLIKSEGIRLLTEYCEPQLGAVRGMAALALAWHTFGTKKQREGITIGDIAKEFGLTAKVVSDAKLKINNQSKALHDRAVGGLDQRFKEGGLVDWE